MTLKNRSELAWDIIKSAGLQRQPPKAIWLDRFKSEITSNSQNTVSVIREYVAIHKLMIIQLWLIGELREDS